MATVGRAAACFHVIHGGYGHGTIQGNLSDLWVVDGEPELANWRQCEPDGAAPSARAGHTLTAVSSAECVLFGGFGDAALEDVHLLTCALALPHSRADARAANISIRHARRTRRGKQGATAGTRR